MGSIRRQVVFCGGGRFGTFLSNAGRRGSVQTAAKEFTMRFKFLGGLAIIAGLCFAAIAMAQPQGQPGGRGGRGGPPGGGGFGMFGGGGPGRSPSRLGLLQMEAVSKELELADEQVTAIRELNDALREKYPLTGGRGPGGPGGGPPGGERGRRGGGNNGNNNEGALQLAPTPWFFVAQEQQPGQGEKGRGGRGGFGNFQPPTPEQQAESDKQRAERDKEANAKLTEILLPHQIKRLNEIYVQQAGTAALLDDEISKMLNVSAAQKTKITELRQQSQEAFGAAMREMFQGGGGGDRDANRTKMEELRKANDAKVLAVLSADQQKKFEELKGKPFEMPDFGRGGPGGGRGAPGGDRGPGGTRGRGGNNN
jgi:hypothetical protein